MAEIVSFLGGLGVGLVLGVVGAILLFSRLFRNFHPFR